MIREETNARAWALACAPLCPPRTTEQFERLSPAGLHLEFLARLQRELQREKPQVAEPLRGGDASAFSTASTAGTAHKSPSQSADPIVHPPSLYRPKHRR